jgi:hypothetical protein
MRGNVADLSDEPGVIGIQMAEVVISRKLFAEILRLIAEFRALAPPAPA